MSLYFNVTDAIGPGTDHGITRTERRLAAALAGRPGVEFVAKQHGRLVGVGNGEVLQALDRRSAGRVPNVERFGIDPVPPKAGLGTIVRDALRDRRRPSGERVRIGVRPLAPNPDDVLLSVGLDWAHDLLIDAERFVYGRGGRYIGFCYDMIPADHPEWVFPPDPGAFLHHLRAVARLASEVWCISESTRRDFIRHFPEYGAERVHVLQLGGDAAISTAPEHIQFADSVFGGAPYAIYCATIDRRKNHSVLYRAMRSIVSEGGDGHLVLVGKMGSGVDDLIDAMRHDGSVAGRIAHVTNCDDEHLAALYQRAAFAVYPSLYEGWGLGVTEALAHGKPCIVASGSSLGEAGLGVCPEVHPLRTTEWVRLMREYFAAPPSMQALHVPTWDRTADDLVQGLGQ